MSAGQCSLADDLHNCLAIIGDNWWLNSLYRIYRIEFFPSTSVLVTILILILVVILPLNMSTTKLIKLVGKDLEKRYYISLYYTCIS